MGSLSILRDFSAPHVPEFEPLTVPQIEHETLCDEAYTRGVGDGESQAKQAIDQEIETTIADLSNALIDANALRQSLISELGPILSQIVRKLCPVLAARGFDDAVHEMIVTDKALISGPLTVYAAADKKDAVTKIANSLGDDSIKVETSAALTGLEVKLKWLNGGGTLNLDKTVEQIIALADSFEEQNSSEREQL